MARISIMATSISRSPCMWKRCLFSLFNTLLKTQNTTARAITSGNVVKDHAHSTARQRHVLSTANILLWRRMHTKNLSMLHSSIWSNPFPQPCPCSVNKLSRLYSSEQSNRIASLQTSTVDPYQLVKDDLTLLSSSIRKELALDNNELTTSSQYHFDSKGKLFRPMVVTLMSRACNIHNAVENQLLPSQQTVAMIAEMIHTASLIHDDVIDASLTRRGKASAFSIWGQRKAILCGDYVMAVSSNLLAKIGNTEVVKVLAQVLDDLVSGEFMQLGSKENESERFSHYLRKTYKKTASLMANSCKAVAILSNCSDDFKELAFQYGRNLGIAFQLTDDLLDFISNEQLMGKPTTADLKLGLATAPVLFAAQQHPELNPMIMRRFNRKGDVETAMKFVEKSDGVDQTRFLAQQHCNEAIRLMKRFQPSVYRDALVTVTEKMLSRMN